MKALQQTQLCASFSDYECSEVKITILTFPLEAGPKACQSARVVRQSQRQLLVRGLRVIDDIGESDSGHVGLQCCRYRPACRVTAAHLAALAPLDIGGPLELNSELIIMWWLVVVSWLTGVTCATLFLCCQPELSVVLQLFLLYSPVVY